MKWTNHANLEAYKIRLEGWPHGIPLQNPSTLTTAQNRQILEALANGTLRFVPMEGMAGPSQLAYPDLPSTLDAEEANVFAEAVDLSWDEEETSKISASTTTSAYSNRDPTVGGSTANRASETRELSVGLTGGQRSGSESAASAATHSRHPSPGASTRGRKRKREGSRT